MRLFKIVGLIIAVFIIFSGPIKYLIRNSYERYIPWTADRKLQWKYFKAKVPADSHHNAMTVCVYNYQERLLGDSMIIHMDNYFLVDSSYVNREGASDYILNHEQRHFDVGEIYVRKMREYVSKWTGADKVDYNAYLLAGFNEIYSDSLAFQYEKQTDHGRNEEYQIIWNTKIDSLLNQYRAFDQSRFKLYLGTSWSDFYDNSYDNYVMFHPRKVRKIDTRD
jgi:hypothetical protein